MTLKTIATRIGSLRNRGRILTSLVSATMVIFFCVGAAKAQQATPPDDREMIKQLMKRIEELEGRLKNLESKQTGTSAIATVAKEPAEKAPTTAEAVHGDHSTPSDAVPSSAPSLQIRGFGDVQYHASDLKGDTNSFLLGQLNLFVTSRLSERLSVLSEMVIEANDENEVGFEIERLILQYSPSEYVNLSIGRYHTGIGYYNTAYHHGTWFQTATGRPFLFAFEDEGGILPIHNVGVSATGRVPSGAIGLHYVAEVGNGRRSRSQLDEPVQNSLDENNGKAFNLGLFARPDAWPGFQTGFSVYRDHLTPEGLPKIGQTIFAAHAIYADSQFEFLNEAVVIRKAFPGSTMNTPGFYTQISKKFGKARPYFRYQYINASDSDPIFSDVGRRNGPSLGLRYDVSEFAAFKTQYDRTARRRLDPVNALTFQLAFTF